MSSMWNVSNWQWEERNRFNEAKKQLLKQFDDFEHDRLKINDLFVDGEAASNIRKGKVISNYDLSIAGNLFDKSTDESWPFKISNIAPELDNALCFDFPEKHDEFMRKNMTDSINEFRQAFHQAEQQFFNTAQLMEKQELERQKSKELRDQGKTSEIQNIAENNLVGESVWNTGGFHWEEKNVTNDVTKKIKDILDTRKEIKGSFGSLEYIPTSSTINGEASISIRKGKKRCFFDYKAKAGFKCVMRDQNGNITNETTGEVIMDDFTPDEKPNIHWKFDKSVKDESIKALILSELEPKMSKDLDSMANQILSENMPQLETA